MLRHAILITALAAMPAAAEIVTKPSPHDVPRTVERLVAAVEGAGAKVVAQVPHGQAAAGAGLELPEAVLVIFGNPEVGTPVMQEDLRAGLVLPLRVLVHVDGTGGAAVTYMTAEDLFAGLDVDAAGEAAGRIDGALGKLTDAAVAE